MNMKQCVSTPTRRQRANHGRVDPFAHRKSFPVFEDAIRTETTIDENSLDNYDTEDIDNSDCSFASTDRLNLSIGARAALDEHLRYVARFGIDDSQCLEEKAREEDCSFESHQKDPRDVLWQKLVDPNFSNNATNNSTHLLPRDMMRLIKKAAIVQSADHSQDVEATNDQSSDYFNSSRVYLLKTPERNRSQRANAVTCRNDEDFVDNSFTASESPACLFRTKHNNHKPIKTESSKNDASPPLGMTRNDHSFLFSAVDLSQISDDGSEDLAVEKSPCLSFALRAAESQTKGGEVGVACPFTRENLQIIRNGNSSPSPRKDAPPLDPNNLSFLFHQRRSAPSTPQFLRRDDVHDFAENLKLSPIGLRSRQATPSSKVESSFSQQKRRSPLSPPSPHDDHISSMLAEYCSTSRSAPDRDFSALPNYSLLSGNLKCEHSLPSPIFSYHSPESSASTFLPRDRRRFRTVVPTRVFLTDSDDFPEEYDSFSVPPESSGVQQSDLKTIPTTS